MDDINWFRDYKFAKTSPQLGDIKMSVTLVNAGAQHNVIPDECRFVVDVRSTDAHSNEEIISIINDHVACDVKPRSTRLRLTLPQRTPAPGQMPGRCVYGLNPAAAR